MGVSRCWPTCGRAGTPPRAEDRAVATLPVRTSRGAAPTKNHPMGEPGVAAVATGRARGIEPPNGGATSRCLNRLATPAAWLHLITEALGFKGVFRAGARVGNGPRSRSGLLRCGMEIPSLRLAPRWRLISVIVSSACRSEPCLPAPRQPASGSSGAVRHAPISRPSTPPSPSPIPFAFTGRFRPRPHPRPLPRWARLGSVLYSLLPLPPPWAWVWSPPIPVRRSSSVSPPTRSPVRLSRSSVKREACRCWPA